jgi:hypothetical protein
MKVVTVRDFRDRASARLSSACYFASEWMLRTLPSGSANSK